MTTKKNDLTRRQFLKRSGTGVLGSYFLLKGVDGAASSAGKNKQKLTGTIKLSLTVNRKKIDTIVNPETTLAELIRDNLKLTGTKIVCNHGECGGCTVVMNKKAVYSCQVLAMDAEGKDVITIEGLMKGEDLHPLQKAFINKDGLQCGFCTPGQIMAAYALLLENPNPSNDEIKNAMAGNLCRCSAYPNIIKSVKEASLMKK